GTACSFRECAQLGVDAAGRVCSVGENTSRAVLRIERARAIEGIEIAVVRAPRAPASDVLRFEENPIRWVLSQSPIIIEVGNIDLIDGIWRPRRRKVSSEHAALRAVSP